MPYLFSRLLADILIAGFLCYYLRENQSSLQSCAQHHLIFLVASLIFDSRTKSLLGKILRYTIATGLATRSVKATDEPR